MSRVTRDECVAYLESLGLPEDARLARLYIDVAGEDAGYLDIDEAYRICREAKIPTECVSKVLAYLQRTWRKWDRLPPHWEAEVDADWQEPEE